MARFDTHARIRVRSGPSLGPAGATTSKASGVDTGRYGRRRHGVVVAVRFPRDHQSRKAIHPQDAAHWLVPRRCARIPLGAEGGGRRAMSTGTDETMCAAIAPGPLPGAGAPGNGSVVLVHHGHGGVGKPAQSFLVPPPRPGPSAVPRACGLRQPGSAPPAPPPAGSLALLTALRQYPAV